MKKAIETTGTQITHQAPAQFGAPVFIQAKQLFAVDANAALGGRSNLAISPSRVDLPEPEAPTMATASRARSLKWASSTMVSVPSVVVTRLVKRVTSIMEAW